MAGDNRRTATYFLSDMHLGAKYFENPRANEMRVVRFLDRIAPTARAIYLLGDVLDYWYEYRSVVPRGHVRFLGKLAELADSGIEITWLTGNHDVWLFDYLRDELGITVIDSCREIDIDGTRLFISHGDDVGWRPWNYRFMRWCFYSKVCQWLYDKLHPDFTHWIASTWSSHNRTHRAPATVQSQIDRSVQSLTTWANEYAASHPDVRYYVMGHLHSVHDLPVGRGARLIILGDWINEYSYAVLDHGEMTLHTFED